MTLEEWKYYRNQRIKELKKEGRSINYIKDLFGIDEDCIRRVLNGEFNWQSRLWKEKLREYKAKRQEESPRYFNFNEPTGGFPDLKKNKCLEGKYEEPQKTQKLRWTRI